MERVPAVVIGAGQAGLAVSHELAAHDVEHVVLEAGRIGETWRTRRWRSFHLVSPNRLNLLPGFWYAGPDPDGFSSLAEVIAYLEDYAASFAAPVRSGVRVRTLRAGDDEFVMETEAAPIGARAVVVATGAFGDARIPAIAGDLPRGVLSIHTDEYRSPDDLPGGGVLVVGSGQSGLQIADELARAGRDVTVAIGRHTWVPRRLYGRDQNLWRIESGDFESVVGDAANPTLAYPPTPLARWGTEDFNVRTVWQSGARLAGHVSGIADGRVAFADDLRGLVAAGDEFAAAFVRRIHDFARERGDDVPEPALESAWGPGEVPAGIASLDLRHEGIGAVIWSTGYRHDFSWIQVPGALSADGAPYQRTGASPVPGLYFVGLHRGWHAGDGTLLGVRWLAESVGRAVAKRLRGRLADQGPRPAASPATSLAAE